MKTNIYGLSNVHKNNKKIHIQNSYKLNVAFPNSLIDSIFFYIIDLQNKGKVNDQNIRCFCMCFVGFFCTCTRFIHLHKII